MIIGVDFDNTIVCYDGLFYDAALEKGLIPKNIPKVKNSIRDYLRKIGKEDDWTKLQGNIYGPGILKAPPFEGVIEFLKYCKKNNIKTFIISHKTLHPYIGSKYNLHKYAMGWIEQEGILDKEITGLDKKDIFFELTKEDKLKRIAKQKCDYFIDDLPEFLLDKEFPSDTFKILFDPSKKYNGNDLERADSWLEIRDKIKNKISKNHNSNEFKKLVSKLSINAGFMGDFTIKPIAGGRNNKVFCVEYENGKKALLKSYFDDPINKKDRLRNEFNFLKFVYGGGIKCVAKPYCADFDNNLGLYEFIEGNKPKVEGIDENKIKQALNFFSQINSNKDFINLHVATEAYFNIKGHIGNIKNRIERLENISINSKIDEEAKEFIKNQLLVCWREVQEFIAKASKEQKININENISDQEKCLSPSDFGYHNCLLDKSNKLFFLDFEYSGVDDPAKMVCDFFCQNEIPVPMKFFNMFIEQVAKTLEDEDKFKERVKILFPLYKIKWCCIILNEFSKEGSERRNFALEPKDLEENKKKQLEKVYEYVKNHPLKNL
ncbi:hypothetical protein CMO93_04675 [Candidatus Woesearchaeota archaeon]|nr:hypothetical protein [Candidatus Woesearchaeota archaeon]|tara:strand:+ start:1357 stop:3000 length:1644 start_codon:yes stop_codon:yes gene_type:complete